jgi:hypothetical protein
MKGKLKMSQISEIDKAIAVRFEAFRNKQEIYLPDKDFKELLKEVGDKYGQVSEGRIDWIEYDSKYGGVVISNRERVPNYVEREQY